MKQNYIKWLRERVGHEEILLNFAAIIVIDEKGRILLQKRSDKKKWGLPGGIVELGESYKDAAIREAYEETGLKVEPFKLLGIYSGPKYRISYPNGDRVQSTAAVFYCKVAGGILNKGKDSETLELRYFAKDELPEIAGPDFEDMIKDALDGKSAVWM